MLDIIFIGTSGSIPTTERGMPAIVMKYGSSQMLFDCGEGSQRQMMKFKTGFGSIDAIFISHPHLDHYLGLFGMLETLRLSSAAPRPIVLFVPPGLDITFVERYGKFAQVKKIKPGPLYQGNGFSVSAFAVKHTRGSFGFIIEEEPRRKFDEKKAKGMGILGPLFKKIQKDGYIIIDKKRIELNDVSWVKPGVRVVYSGDTTYDERTVLASKGADLLIHESTFDPSRAAEAKERDHSTSEDAANVAKEAGVKQLVLTHISPRYSDDFSPVLEAAKKIFKNTLIAEDGMRIRL